jgi:hypothetical protein
MRKKIEWKWEVLDEHTSRCKVIGGWIVVCLVQGKDHTGKTKQISSSMTFIPDRDHEWTISEPL